jgi:Glycosyltransferase family 87
VFDREQRVRALPLVCVALLAAAAVAVALVAVAPELEAPPQLFSDFDINVWEPGRAILEGRSPLRRLDAEPQNGSVYPPAAQVATLPFALLPHDVGLVLWLATLGAAVAFALRLCGVRDWRLFAVALCSPPVLYGFAYANLSLLITFALALTWVWRDQHRRAAIVVGALIAARLFLWPVLVWLVITRRFRATAEALLATVVLSLVGWAAVAFRRIDEFTLVVRDNASEYIDDGVSVASIASNLGLSVPAASAVGLAAGIAALALAWWAREQDLESFSWAIVAALFASPVVWSHYYALLLVPLALSTPMLSRWWLLPYLTIPQLTVAAGAGGRVLDAAAGIAFATMTPIRCRNSARARQPEPLGERVESSARDAA